MRELLFIQCGVNIMDERQKRRQIIIREILKALFPMAVTAGILFLVFALKQIFPFGENTIDYYDMGQQEAALYYHAWDFLHGGKSAFFDWYSGLGVNMSSATTGFNIFSNLFLLCVKRSAIFKSLSLLVALRLSLCALTMYLFLREESDAGYSDQVLFSVLYALSGYCLQYYVISTFSEISIFFPLVFLFFLRLLRGKSFLPYIFLVVCSMITSYYLCAMILVFLIMAAGLYLILFVEKTQRKEAIMRLGLATASAVLISCFLLVPQLMQTSASSRFTNDAGGISQYLEILKNEYGGYTSRWWHLLDMTPAMAVTFMGCIRCIRKKENRRQMVFLLGLIFLIGISLLAESVGLMLHFGSYVQFPVRNGFILCFSLCLSGAFFSKDMVWKKPGAAAGIAGTSAAVFVCALAAAILLRGYFRSDIWDFRRIFHVSVFVCMVLFVCYFLLLCFRKKWALRPVFLSVALTEMIMASMLLAGKPHYTTGYAEEPEQDGGYVERTMALAESLSIETGEIDRIKNPDTTLNANYPFIMRRAALSNWTHLINGNHQTGVDKLGYATHFTRLLDSGGTVFSDALLHVTQAVSCQAQDENLYGLRTEAQGYGLYDCRYTLPFGLAANDSVRDIALKKQNFITLQNDLYYAVTGDHDLIEPVLADGKWNQVEGRKIPLMVPVKEEGILYFECSNGTEEEDYLKITVNGETVPVPTVSEPLHEEYPAHFNNGLLNLGVYENEEVAVEIETLKEVKPEDLHIRMGILNLDKFRKLCENEASCATDAAVSGRHLALTAIGSGEKNMFLIPVAFNKGFRAEVNGRRQPVYEVAGAFMAVPIEEGENAVELTFVPDGMRTGVFLSAAGILSLAGAVVLTRRRMFAIPVFVQRAAAFCFWVCFAGIGVFVYVIPAAANLLGFLLKIVT